MCIRIVSPTMQPGALMESVDLPTVAWLGHERLDTVRIYSQPDEAALEDAALALEER
jgi:hypothetical protein